MRWHAARPTPAFGRRFSKAPRTRCREVVRWRLRGGARQCGRAPPRPPTPVGLHGVRGEPALPDHQPTKKGGRRRPFSRYPGPRSAAVVELELDGMRGVLVRVDLFPLEIHVSRRSGSLVNIVPPCRGGPWSGREGSPLRFAQGCADGGDALELLGRQVRRGPCPSPRPGSILVLDPVEPAIQEGRETEIGVRGGVGEAGLDALGPRALGPRECGRSPSGCGAE